MTPNEMTKCGGGCGNVGLRMRCYDSEQYQHINMRLNNMNHNTILWLIGWEGERLSLTI
jgi:hypothetical protein